MRPKFSSKVSSARLYGNPHIDVAGNWIFQARWRDASHLVRLSAQVNRRPENREIAIEPRAPERVAQDDATCAALIVQLEPGPAERRPQRPEIVVGDAQDAQPLRLAASHEVEPDTASERSGICEQRGLVAEREVVWADTPPRRVSGLPGFC